MKKIKECPVCCNQKFVFFKNCVDFSVSKESFTIIKCVECNFLITSPRPIDRELNKYYLSDDYISHTNNKTGFLNFLYHTARYFTLRKKLRLIDGLSKKGTLIDIGCGTGEFLNICKKNLWESLGVEPSEIARKKAINNYFLDVRKDISFSKFRNSNFMCVSLI